MQLIFYCTAALTLLSDSVSYITILFSEWCICARIMMKQTSTYSSAVTKFSIQQYSSWRDLRRVLTIAQAGVAKIP